jgi:hypothetical protein
MKVGLKAHVSSNAPTIAIVYPHDPILGSHVILAYMEDKKVLHSISFQFDYGLYGPGLTLTSALGS